MGQPDTWSETAKVSICAQSGSDVHFQTITETVDIDIGDKDFDAIATLSGGRLVKFNPQDVIEITLEAYPVEAGTESGTTGTGFFDLMNSQDTSEAQTISVDRDRDEYRLAIMWTDASVDAEDAVTSPTNSALRVVAADGYFTSVKPSFTDGVLKFTVKFRVPPFDKSGSANFKMESVDGTDSATLAALASYTSTTKW